MLANCIALAFYDIDIITQLDSDDASLKQRIRKETRNIDILNIVFTGTFFLEGSLKSVHRGLIMHKKSYIRRGGGWAIIDLIVVASGYVLPYLFIVSLKFSSMPLHLPPCAS